VALETKTPPKLIYRVARLPDAWEPPDWARALPHGTFDNRFDDPENEYRVLYASSQEVGCFLETLARFRLDLPTLVAVKAIQGEDDFAPPGEFLPDGRKTAPWERRDSKETTPTSAAASGLPIFVRSSRRIASILV